MIGGGGGGTEEFDRFPRPSESEEMMLAIRASSDDA